MVRNYLVNEVFVAFFGALLFAWIAIPAFSFLARKFGLVDVPDEHRKLHRHAIPLVGGISIFFATTLAIAVLLIARLVVFADWSGWAYQFQLSSKDAFELGGLLLGSFVLLVVGVLDDRFGLRGRHKLAGQLVACTILIWCGFQFDEIQVRSRIVDFDFKFGSFAAVASYIWLLGAINSINLLDGADGFAGTIGGIMGIAFCLMALATGSVVDAAIIAAFTGAILGFMRFNFPPAKVYLGDAGSMLIGFIFAALAIRCTFKQATMYAFLGPLALLSIPFLDTAAAIVRRRLTGRSIYSVDRAHLHHSLAGHGYGPRGSLFLVAILSTLTAAGGTLSIMTRQSEYAVVAVALVMLFLVANRLFGWAELKLVLNKFGALLSSLKSLRSKTAALNRSSVVQLQGRRDWQLIWQNIREFSEKHDFKMVKLHLHLPWLQEFFHARYDKAGADLIEVSDNWYFVIPVSVADRCVGEIEVVALKNRELLPYETIGQMMEMIADLEPQFVEIMESPDPRLTDSVADTIRLVDQASQTVDEDSGITAASSVQPALNGKRLTHG